MRTRQNNVRWGAALTALVYVFGWLLAFSHNVTEQHVVCVEHGDLVHADDHGHGHEHGDEPLIESNDEAEHHASLDALPVHADHEHCAIGPFVRNDDAVDWDTAISVPPERVVATSVERTPTEANRPPPVAILAFAPKTSPPIA